MRELSLLEIDAKIEATNAHLKLLKKLKKQKLRESQLLEQLEIKPAA